METPEEHKLRAIRLTTACRFSAADRLRRHERFSLFSITMSSLAVVIVSLMEPFGLKLAIPSNAVNLICAALSLLILVVSLMVSGNKYGERAEKMHAGGVEINSVARRLEPAIKAANKDEIERLTDTYENILKIYENHKPLDYKVAQITSYAEHYKITSIDRIWVKVLLLADVFPHIWPIAIVCWLISFAVKGVGF
jgi:SMODS and SLOG-associating 2TM effector domain family 5